MHTALKTSVSGTASAARTCIALASWAGPALNAGWCAPADLERGSVGLEEGDGAHAEGGIAKTLGAATYEGFRVGKSSAASTI